MWKKWWGRKTETGAPDVAGERAGPPVAPREAHPSDEYTAEDEELLDRIARAVVKWGMTVPAIFTLESSKPLSFVGGQFLHFLSPIVHSVMTADQLDRLAIMLERRETVEHLIQRIERMDSEDRSKKKTGT